MSSLPASLPPCIRGTLRLALAGWPRFICGAPQFGAAKIKAVR